MGIPAIPSTVKQASNTLDNALERATSLNEELLLKVTGVGTKAELCDELKKLEPYVPTLGSLTINPDKFTKVAIAKRLVLVQKIAFAKVVTTRAELEEGVQEK